MPVDILVKVGRRLRYFRTQRGISQTVIAEQAGITRRALSSIENGKAEAGLRTLYDLTQALGIKLVDLMGNVD